MRLLSTSVEIVENALAHFARTGKLTATQEHDRLNWVALKGATHKTLRRWTNTVADLNGQVAAIKRFLDTGGFQAITAAGDTHMADQMRQLLKAIG